MKRLQIMIDEDLDVELERQARAERTSKAALVRRYVRAALDGGSVVDDDALWSLVGFVTGEPDYSASIDDVAYGPRNA